MQYGHGRHVRGDRCYPGLAVHLDQHMTASLGQDPLDEGARCAHQRGIDDLDGYGIGRSRSRAPARGHVTTAAQVDRCHVGQSYPLMRMPFRGLFPQRGRCVASPPWARDVRLVGRAAGRSGLSSRRALRGGSTPTQAPCATWWSVTAIYQRGRPHAIIEYGAWTRNRCSKSGPGVRPGCPNAADTARTGQGRAGGSPGTTPGAPAEARRGAGGHAPRLPRRPGCKPGEAGPPPVRIYTAAEHAARAARTRSARRSTAAPVARLAGIIPSWAGRRRRCRRSASAPPPRSRHGWSPGEGCSGAPAG